jgi:hypothetical protein
MSRQRARQRYRQHPERRPQPVNQACSCCAFYAPAIANQEEQTKKIVHLMVAPKRHPTFQLMPLSQSTCLPETCLLSSAPPRFYPVRLGHAIHYIALPCLLYAPHLHLPHLQLKPHPSPTVTLPLALCCTGPLLYRH